MRNKENERCPEGSWDVEVDLSREEREGGGWGVRGWLPDEQIKRQKETIFSGRQNKQLRMRDCCTQDSVFSFFFPSVKNVHLESPGEEKQVVCLHIFCTRMNVFIPSLVKN